MRGALSGTVSVPTHNADIAAAFGEIADLPEIRSDNPFRMRAYRNAARSIPRCMLEPDAGEFDHDAGCKQQHAHADLRREPHQKSARQH